MLVGATLTLSAQIAVCGDASSPTFRKGQWDRVCLDRLTIELPAPLEIAATELEYQGGVNFPGLTGTGSTGIKWSGIRLDETYQTDAKVYERLLSEIRATVPSQLQFDAALSSYKQAIREQEDLLKTSPPETRPVFERGIQDRKDAIKETLKAKTLSGEAQINTPNAFALRRREEFITGHIDLIDKRIRIFEGKLAQPEIESPSVAADEYERLKRIYHRRAPTEIPTTQGYCTGYGFIDESLSHTANPGDELNLPLRSLRYPNLVFILIVTPSNPKGPRDVAQLGNPNAIRTEDVNSLKGLGAVGALAERANIKRTYGPKAAQIAGQPGRILAREYKHRGYMHDGGPATAYEIEAEVLGEPGRADRPHIKLQLAAALADDPKLPRDQKPTRPAIKGLKPPPFEEGLRYFEEVLKSVRMRPVATNSVAPSASGSR